jgi:uncharacterized membrane protein
MLERRGETAALSFHRKDPDINVGSAERGFSALAGAGLLVAALRVRSGRRAALGALLLARGATGRCPFYRRLGIATGQAARVPAAGFPLVRAKTIGAGREPIVDAVRHPARWLPDDVEATPLGPDRWRIALHLPGGRTAATELVSRVEQDGSLGWRSVTGGAFAHQGRIFVAEAPQDRGTELRVVASVRPPGGRAGLVLARPLRAVVERGLGVVLARLKQFVETGEVATSVSAPRRAQPPRRIARGQRREAA